LFGVQSWDNLDIILEHGCPFLCRGLDSVQRVDVSLGGVVPTAVELSSEREVPDFVGHVEVGRRKGLHVVYVNTTHTERAAWSNVKRSPNPVDFNETVNLTSLFEGLGLGF